MVQEDQIRSLSLLGVHWQCGHHRINSVAISLMLDLISCSGVFASCWQIMRCFSNSLVNTHSLAYLSSYIIPLLIFCMFTCVHHTTRHNLVHAKGIHLRHLSLGFRYTVPTEATLHGLRQWAPWLLATQ